MPAQPIPGKSFIEVQFPVSKISKESYKERKSQQFQTLTQLGKWWGPKPLILARAAILGLLLPATDNPAKDREIFLKLLTMDDEGLWRRKKSNIPYKEIASYLSQKECGDFFDLQSSGRLRLRSGLSREQRENIQKIVFERMDYKKKISYCVRPEEIEGPSEKAWEEVNAHLEIHAKSFHELVKELGERHFDSMPRVGDCFCGRGNIPFEAARLGCDAYAADLSPVAALIAWAAFHIIGGGDEIVKKVAHFQKRVYDAVEKQINEWGIETNKEGWRAYAYLYCNEIVCPECGWTIPLLSSRVIAERMQRVIAELVPDNENKRFNIEVKTVETEDEIEAAKIDGTIIESQIRCPNPFCQAHTAPLTLAAIRRESTNGLRMWEEDDIIPRLDDIFQERLICIRWEENTITPEGAKEIKWHYLAPTIHDFKNEELTLQLLLQRFRKWKNKGFVPTLKIEPGEKTGELIRTRGWTYWHHIYTSRQLLYHGLINEVAEQEQQSVHENVTHLLGIGRCSDWNSKLCQWASAVDLPQHTFYNQALNPMYLYGDRGIHLLSFSWFLSIISTNIISKTLIKAEDARLNKEICTFWITDPPYADAVVYHELSEYFLAWYSKLLPDVFPDWVPDSKRALAIRGSGDDFKRGMIDSYRNLTYHMPENGIQIVMFTHQNAAVWADLTIILWAAGLQVSAAWCIATETSSGIRQGNYVQGTVLLVLRKQTSNETAFLDEIYPEVESEVKRQLDTMLAIDDKDDPNFGDTDYQLAAYAAALRVLTKYKKIEEIDIEREIARVRQNGEKSPLEIVIENAVKIACDHLVPKGIDSFLWKQLGPEERFYLKGLELESHGEYRIGAYQELARGFGIRNYRDMQESGRANETRLRTASEFKDRFLRDEGFGSSLVRQVLFAVRQTQQENDTAAGKAWLRGLPNYWDRRKDIIGILQYLASIGISDTMPQWQEDAKAARLLAGAVEQDHV
jgi:adenine-specific DNA methylase